MREGCVLFMSVHWSAFLTTTVCVCVTTFDSLAAAYLRLNRHVPASSHPSDAITRITMISGGGKGQRNKNQIATAATTTPVTTTSSGPVLRNSNGAAPPCCYCCRTAPKQQRRPFSGGRYLLTFCPVLKMLMSG